MLKYLIFVLWITPGTVLLFYLVWISKRPPRSMDTTAAQADHPHSPDTANSDPPAPTTLGAEHAGEAR